MLRRLVWPNGAPRPQRSAAHSLYPNLNSSFRQFEIVAPAPQQTRPKSSAQVIYAHLRTENK